MKTWTCPTRRCRPWLALAAAAIFAGAAEPDPVATYHRRRLLLHAEIENIVDLLQLGCTDFAAAHLDVIRRVFPDQTRVIGYYDGVIHYRRGRYAAAAGFFAAVATAADGDDGDHSDVLYYLFRCRWHLGQLDRAEKVITDMEAASGPSPLTANARMALALAFQRRSQGERRQAEDRARALRLARPVIEANPAHPQAAWFRFTAAEMEYETIEKALGEVGGRGKELPPALRRKMGALRDRYAAIRRRYAKSEYAVNADFRYHFLNELLGE